MEIVRFLKSNMMFTVAALATSVFVPFDREYLGYFDLKTLACLFCVLAVVCGLKNVNFFYVLASHIVRRFHNARVCTLALVYITFIGSMFITNDMALLTFLPLGFLVLSETGRTEYMAYLFVLQNIAAILLSEFTTDYKSLLLGVNIGGMGTLIAPLAGLITYREYLKHDPEGSGKFLGLFSGLGFGFLAVLLGFEYLPAVL